ncbi:MAG: Arm DNA-binding domain-containing protein [Schleiferilactobacillus harbinensis]|nr:Arm DNA-binding domain-containing protein [Schleiferilactobacillus harbinensis]
MKAIRKATLFVYPILPDWEVNTMASFRKRGKTWTYVVNYTDSNGVRHQKTLGGFAKKKMAENAAAEVEHHLMQGADLNKQDTTLIEY